ncbi:NAD(P)/FAD-dependent oxidoreductase [Sphingomonas sp. dw_22]|uniref:flavin monoamine oxidase family protein n=1 Tax=Sphingomonas sp. dw_22 TaxID=2721175 RepID=UPI001BD3031C|nr:NAD(P)/FAD-dependent oxidoreductase [Sphingomonas sp. dw_22]
MRAGTGLWQALEAARRSNLREAGEAPPTAGSPGTTRRALLKGLVAAGLVPALPRPAHAFRGGRVAIVGGGMAGLSALHHLREAGVDAHLYEARGRSGGRMFTHRPAQGTPFEAGGQLVNTDHADMHALAGRFGIELIDRKAEPHRTLILAGSHVVAEDSLAEALRPIAAQIARDADRIDRSPRIAAELDRLSIRGYLQRHAALMPDAWVLDLLEATSRTEYGVEPDKASAITLIWNLPTVDGQRIEVLGESDERFAIRGGSSALVEAMAEAQRGRISTGKRLLGIRSAREDLTLSFLDGSTTEAETVILAVPAPITRQIDFAVPLPSAWRAYIAAMELGRNEKVQARATEAVWKAPMGTGGELWQSAADAGYALGWDGSVHLTDTVDPVWTWFLGGNEVDADDSPEALAQHFAASAESALPGIGAATRTGPFRRTAWHRDPLTLGAYSTFAPGQLTRFGHLMWLEDEGHGATQVAGTGSILFAGEHLSDAWPGYMNGAAQTGRLAAEAVTGKRALRHAA